MRRTLRMYCTTPPMITPIMMTTMIMMMAMRPALLPSVLAVWAEATGPLSAGVGEDPIVPPVVPPVEVVVVLPPVEEPVPPVVPVEPVPPVVVVEPEEPVPPVVVVVVEDEEPVPDEGATGSVWIAVTATARAEVVRKIEALAGEASCAPSVVLAKTAALVLGRAMEKERSTDAGMTVSETAVSGTPTSSATLLTIAARTTGVKSLGEPVATTDAVIVYAVGGRGAGAPGGIEGDGGSGGKGGDGDI